MAEATKRPWFLGSSLHAFLTILVVLAVPMGMLVLSIHSLVRQSLETQTIAEVSATSRVVAEALKTRLEDARQDVARLARQPVLRTALETRDRVAVQAQLRDLVAANPEFQGALVVDPRGRLRYAYPHSSEQIGRDLSHRDWFQSVARTQRVYVSEVYRRVVPPLDLEVGVAAPIRNSRQQIIGYLEGVQSVAPWTFSYQNGQKVPVGTTIALLDHRGHLITRPLHSGQSLTRLAEDSPLRKSSSASGVVEAPNPITGAPSWIGYEPIRNVGWGVLVWRSNENVFALLPQLTRTIFLYSLLALAGMSLLGAAWAATVRRADQAQRLTNAELLARTEDLQRATERLKDLDRLKTNFVNAVSHDLRSPLTSIIGYGEFLEEGIGGPLSQKQQEFVRQIEKNSRRLEHLVDDLLDYARIEAGLFPIHCEVANLGQKVAEVVADLRPQVEEAGLQLQIGLPETPLTLSMDPRGIERVLTNLLHNAIKHSPRGGTIRIDLSVRPDAICCEVSDQGAGIAPQDLPKLFQPFSQLESGRRKGGTGLGLSICKTVIDAHGGQIGVRSELEAGSTFWFTLPFSEAPEERTAQLSA